MDKFAEFMMLNSPNVVRNKNSELAYFVSYRRDVAPAGAHYMMNDDARGFSM